MLTDDEFKGFLKLLGRRIRAVRKEKNVDMRQVMTVSGYYDAQWRKYEGGGSMNLETLEKNALTLDVPLSYPLGDLERWPIESVAQISEASSDVS